MSKDISNSADVLDTRDIQKRIDELQGERDALDSAVEEIREERDEAAQHGIDEEKAAEFNDAIGAAEAELKEWDDDNGDELKVLLALKGEAKDYCEWNDGAALVRRSYWVEFAQSECEEPGFIPRDLPSFIIIDWEATAKNIETDYTTVDFDGVEYLVRCS